MITMSITIVRVSEQKSKPASANEYAAHHMVDTQCVDAAELQRARDGVSDNGGSQVAHMHLLGHIG